MMAINCCCCCFCCWCSHAADAVGVARHKEQEWRRAGGGAERRRNSCIGCRCFNWLPAIRALAFRSARKFRFIKSDLASPLPVFRSARDRSESKLKLLATIDVDCRVANIKCSLCPMPLRHLTDRETTAGQLVIISMRRPATIGGKFAGTPLVPGS